jgi:hypothetical protein
VEVEILEALGPHHGVEKVRADDEAHQKHQAVHRLHPLTEANESEQGSEGCDSQTDHSQEQHL